MTRRQDSKYVGGPQSPGPYLNSSDTSPISATALAALADKAWAADARRIYAVARENYEAVLRHDPHHVFALSRLLTIDGLEGRMDEAEARHRRLVEGLGKADLAAVHWPYLATIAFQNVVRPLPQSVYQAVTRELDRRLAGAPKAERKKVLAGRRLKIGYLSGLFRDHPVGHVTAALFAAHDRARFEVHVFFRPESGAPNPYTDAVRKGAEHFVTLPGDPRGMAAAIAARNLDILIYIDGYTELDMLQAAALRPAPVQAFWLGHAGGCEISAIDYLIADATVVPPGEESLYSAEVIRLPGAYHCASPHRIAAPVSRAWAGLPEQGFVFCAFNNPEKIERAAFDIWMNILKRVEGSVLWLSRTASPAVEENFRAAASARGVDPARLIFAARVPDKAQHMARHALCGLFLDTFTFNANATALDALWTGLPVLTCEGTRFGGRFGATALRSLGLADLIVKTPAAYEARAVHLATHAEELDELRGLIAGNRYTEPLFQIDVFCRGLEEALERMAGTRST